MIKSTAPFLSAGLLAVVLVGCQQLDRLPEMRNAEKSATGMVKSAWITTSREAQKLSDRSARAALDAAHDKMVDLQAELANIKIPDKANILRQAYAEEEVARLQAAIDKFDLQGKMDAKVNEAKQAEKFAGKKVDEIKDILARTDKTFRRWQDELDEARTNYRAAENTVKDLKSELKKAGVVLP